MGAGGGSWVGEWSWGGWGAGPVLVHAALAGSSAQLQARQAGGMLSVPALLLRHIRKKGHPHPGNAILREAKQETWTPSHVTGISQGQLQRCPGLDKKWERKAAPRSRYVDSLTRVHK